jgi:hypothetical protein
MVTPTPHPGALVHFPLVENISMIYVNTSISKKAKKSLLRAGEGILVRKNEEKWGRGGREEDYMVISIIISTKEVL